MGLFGDIAWVFLGTSVSRVGFPAKPSRWETRETGKPPWYFPGTVALQGPVGRGFPAFPAFPGFTTFWFFRGYARGGKPKTAGGKPANNTMVSEAR